MVSNSAPVVETTVPQPAAAVDPDPFEKISMLARIAHLTVVVLPILGLLAGIYLMWGHGFGWIYGALLVGMYLISAMGVTVGYHRLFCHRSFETVPAVKFMLAVFGGMAFEGSVIKWTAVHRCHHQHSDHNGDPHSPHLHGHGFMEMMRGLWHAHVGWLFQGDPKDVSRYVADLVRDRVVTMSSKFWAVWALLGLIIPAVLGGLLTMSWWGVLLGFLWGGVARIFFVHHITWSINSVCHIWGARPFRSHDHSRNNVLFGVIGLGEGWHNNHHAFPTSARHGLAWWQIDASYMIIRTLELLGLAWNVRVPSPERIAAKLAR